MAEETVKKTNWLSKKLASISSNSWKLNLFWLILFYHAVVIIAAALGVEIAQKLLHTEMSAVVNSISFLLVGLFDIIGFLLNNLTKSFW